MSEEILKIRAAQGNGQYQEAVTSVSKGWWPLPCKGIGACVVVGLTGGLKGPFQGIMVTAGLSQFSTEEQSPLPGPPEIF